jgi:hypothetical protein
MSIIHILISYHITILIYQAKNIGDSFDHLGEIFSTAKNACSDGTNVAGMQHFFLN